MPVALTAGIDGSNYGGWLDSMSADLLLNSANTLMVLFLDNCAVSGATDNLSYASFRFRALYQYMDNTITLKACLNML